VNDRKILAPHNILLVLGTASVVLAIGSYFGFTEETLDASEDVRRSGAFHFGVAGLLAIFAGLIVRYWSSRKVPFTAFEPAPQLALLFLFFLAGLVKTHLAWTSPEGQGTVFACHAAFAVGELFVLLTAVGLWSGKTWGWWCGWIALYAAAIALVVSHIGAPYAAPSVAQRYGPPSLLIGFSFLGSTFCRKTIRTNLKVTRCFSICRSNLIFFPQDCCAF